ncbi:MAG: rhodanese-like domain-containing protein [Terrimicrobiaceae bacterium]|nr:rhodanese-like domain-containing protein [Terrimicrobiaceae bacterium]
MPRRFILGLLVFAIPSVLEARSDFEHPNSFIGNAGWSRGLELWVEIAEIPVARGMNLPLRLRFASDVTRGNSLFGDHWLCPLLESAGGPSEGCVEWTPLGGGKKFLLKSGESEFRSKDRGTTAHEVDGTCEITSGGWRCQYRDGKIVGVNTPDGKRLIWQYQDGFPTAIRRESDGADLLRVSRTSDTIKIHGVFGDVVFRMESPGWFLKFPDGREMRIEISPDGPDISKMTVTSTGESEQVFRWKAGALLSDNDFTYEIRRTDTGEDVLHRVDRKGRTEWYTFDTARGLAIYKRQDGSRVLSWYHVDPGPTYMKCFRMDTLSKDQALVSSRLLTYDAGGKVEKEWTEQGAGALAKAPGVRFISVGEAEQLHGQPHVIFIDARKKDEFARGHIPGAVRVGRSSFEADYPDMENRLKAADTLVVYCISRQCEDSSLVATRLSQLGYESVLIFEGGWAEWWKRHR